MSRWIEPQAGDTVDRPNPDMGLSKFLVKLLADRGVTSDGDIKAFLDPEFFDPTPADKLPGIEEGVREITRVINARGKIGVWGDFDVDGQTATTLLVSALKCLGADVVYHIPVRATESHGIKIPYLEEFMRNSFDLLLTCDTGISEHRAIEYAKKSGLRVVITDHHDLPANLPEAEAIINPKLLPNDHPLAHLPGVGVAYKLIEFLYGVFGREGDQVLEYLDLVALGIVADVAKLSGDTRYLLQVGLQQLRRTKRLGLLAMCAKNDLAPGRLTEEDIGYVLAPRLNALGRLGDANLIVEFLITEDQVEANVTAEMLEGLNAKRKYLSDHVFTGALAELERHPEYLNEAAIVVCNDYWPPGVVGIVASRLVEIYQKPAVLLKTNESGLAQGSARSIEICDISTAIRNCGDLLESFGGHPMAAGLTLRPENIGSFRRRLSLEVSKQIGEEAFEPKIVIDRFVDLDEIDLPLVEEISKLAPFGNGNPIVRFAVRNVSLVGNAFLGRSQAHRKLVIEDSRGTRRSVLWWKSNTLRLPSKKFDLAFSVRGHYYQGERSVQMILEDFREIEEATQGSKPPVSTKIIDHRKAWNPAAILNQLRTAETSLQVWGEGEVEKEIKEFALGRHQLTQTEILAIWTPPPNLGVLASVLERCKPSKVVIFGVSPGAATPSEFLNRLAGLVKYVLTKKAGLVNPVELAVATAQTEILVRLGLSWLELKGDISVTELKTDLLEIETHSSAGLHFLSLAAIREDLDALLAESRLFREYFLNCDQQLFAQLFE